MERRGTVLNILADWWSLGRIIRARRSVEMTLTVRVCLEVMVSMLWLLWKDL